MRVLKVIEVSEVFGGLMVADGDTPTSTGGTTNFPNQCPPGYTGATVLTVSNTSSAGLGMSGTAGVTGVTTGASGTITSAPPTVTTTATQVCPSQKMTTTVRNNIEA